MFIFKWFALQLRILKNCFKQTKSQFLFRSAIRGMMFIVALTLLYFFLIRMFDFSLKRQMPAFDFAAILLSFSLLVFLPLLVYSTIICALSFLFQKEEIGFYFSLPIKRTQVFMVKFWQTFYRSSWMVFCGILTFIIAIQTYFHISSLIYIGGIIASIAYLLIPVCLGVCLTLVLSRIIPFVRAKGIITVIGLFIGSLIGLAIRMMQPERLVSAEGKLRLLTYVQSLRSPWMTILPSEWLTNVCVAYYKADKLGILANIFILFVVAILLLIFIYILVKAFYLRIWTESINIPLTTTSIFRWEAFLKFFPKPLRMFVKKDLLSFYRDTVERGSLLVFIPMSVLYFYSMYVLIRHIRSYGENLFSFLYQYLFNLFYAGLVICGLAGRWVFPSITAEGENFKLLRLVPIALREFIREKFWLGFVPLFILGEILVIGSCFIMNISLFLAIFAFFIMLILVLGITAIAIILGIKTADFSVKQMLDFALSYNGLNFLIAEFLFIIGIIALASIPIVEYLRSRFMPLTFFSFIIFSLAITLVFYFVLYLPYHSAIMSLEKRDI